MCNRSLYLSNRDRYEQTDFGNGLVGLNYPWGDSNEVVGMSVGRGGKGGEKGASYR